MANKSGPYRVCFITQPWLSENQQMHREIWLTSILCPTGKKLTMYMSGGPESQEPKPRRKAQAMGVQACSGLLQIAPGTAALSWRKYPDTAWDVSKECPDLLFKKQRSRLPLARIIEGIPTWLPNSICTLRSSLLKVLNNLKALQPHSVLFLVSKYGYSL